jgi:hypothetical protein
LLRWCSIVQARLSQLFHPLLNTVLKFCMDCDSYFGTFKCGSERNCFLTLHDKHEISGFTIIDFRENSIGFTHLKENM